MRHSWFHICLQNSSLKYEKLIDHFILDHNTWISLDKVWFKRNVVHHISGNPGYLGTGTFSYGLQPADRLALRSLPHPAIWKLYDQEGETINHLSVPCAFEQQMESGLLRDASCVNMCSGVSPFLFSCCSGTSYVFEAVFKKMQLNACLGALLRT